MSIIVYADESGTHDKTGKLKGAEVPVVGGYLALHCDRTRFCQDWKAILDEYSIPYFHAREFEDRDERKSNPKSHYYLWDDEKAESFKYKLAEIAGRNVPVGGGHHLKERLRKQGASDSYPYKDTFQLFFIDLLELLHERKLTSETISIIFDQNEDKEWRFAFRAVAEEWRKNGLKIDEPNYRNKKEYPNWPLQAADMFAYRARKRMFEQLQTNIDQNAATRLTPTVFDLILNRNLRPDRRWRPTITPGLLNAMVELSAKHVSVKRALEENTWMYFALRNERQKRESIGHSA